ncbi:ABC transporter permease subunit [Actibacterium sp. 188UL27-1]|uniref:ABC transporter permease subunit n=1 Tax=Actibacterium sp. 188UL27-1 TaxID=2786961 RepID=UPI00195B1FEA|nr:ABC transporter permease subunit [Actibacterium sp. 188UL27-1]MBM7070304.1 ABC transporter permease subunit [Actibacterium sp. 188UL27-1]
MSKADELRRKAKRRKILIQAGLIGLSVLVIVGAVTTARTNLEAQGLTSGFGFLDRSTGWDYSFSLVPKDIMDPYARTLFVGFLNTLFVGFIAIFLTTLFGFIIGTARDASNIAIKSAATVYVQIFRNIPLILQLVFLYAVLINLPGPRQAMSMGDTVFLSNRGLMLPGLSVTPGVAVGLLLASFALGVFLIWRKMPLFRGLVVWLGGSILMCLVTAFAMRPEGASLVSVPALQGLRFRGGITIPIELFGMIIAITLYGSAYIAEVVRGGLAQVPKGLTEAGQALGLTTGQIWSRIKIPMALRSIIPPLGNQWIFMMKATTIGVAIGFSDLFYIVSISITQSGQTLELIAILAGAFLLVNGGLAVFTNWLNARMKLKAH